MALIPPKTSDWSTLRPTITDLYKSQQHTARQIVEELRQQGWLVTEKMLRDRLKKWSLRKNGCRRSIVDSFEFDMQKFVMLEDEVHWS